MGPLRFRVEFVHTLREKNCWKFRDGFLNADVEEAVNPFFSFASDKSGFIIWKSMNLNALEARTVLSQKNFVDDELPFFNFPHLLIYYDAERQILIFGKDSLGLSSLVYRPIPITLSSDHFDGEEHPPGYSFFSKSLFKKLNFNPFAIDRSLTSISVSEAAELLKSALVQSVNPAFPVLFSGGLDSTLVAAAVALAGANSVHLINFCASENAPDRISSRASFADLQRAFPSVKWDLSEYTASVSDMASKLELISSLLIPQSKTEMNLNIAMTLYGSVENAKSFAVHSGLGADELFCGYMRMKNQTSADSEILEHLARLWERNGGRDDRVASHLGSLLICPYLSEKFINVALKLPISMVIHEELPRGQGEKWILRQLAHSLCLESAAERPKQAMQFGSKVAKANWRGTEEIPQS